MNACAQIRDHLLIHGNRDAVPVYQHVAHCPPCGRFAADVLKLERELGRLKEVSAPEPWLERLWERPELGQPATTPRDRDVRLLFEMPPRRWRASVWSLLAHAACLFVALALAARADLSIPVEPSSVRIVFYDLGEGPGGGGGGGGALGEAPASALDLGEPKADSAGETAPRKIPALALDTLSAPDVPDVSASLLDSVFSPETPGLRLEGPGSLSLDSAGPSSGTGGGLGGGEGSGAGEGDGWGIGDGTGGGSGGGFYRPGSWDVNPVLITRGPDPVYPPKALEASIEGEVILEIRVHVDGSTEVLRVVKSLRYCVEAAKAVAVQYRWRPALSNGKPVEAVGVLMVRFELFARR